MLALLLGFCTLLFGYRLEERDLWSSHEGRAGQNARAIVDEGCWGLPHLSDFRVELQKPPFYYWLVALVSHARGGRVDAFSVRVPAAAAALLAVVLTYLFLGARSRWQAGLLAAFSLATMVHFTSLARTGRIDMPLSAAITLSVLCYYQGWQRCLAGQRAWPCWLLAAFACAAGILLKGPIGIVLPAAVVALHLLVENVLAHSEVDRPTRLSSRHVLLAAAWVVPLILVLTLPWFLWANRATSGELWQTFFVHHNFTRAFGGGGELRSYPFWYYVPRLAVDLLPWSLLLPAALWQLARSGRFRTDPEARFGLLWLLAMLGVLSCAGFKRADYLLPLYPGAALVLGCWLDERLAWVRPARLIGAATLLGAVFLVGWGYYAARVLPAAEPGRQRRSFARVIREHAPRPQLVLFFRCEDHALAFHVGKPINTILEWENIDTWAGRPGTHYVVMPPDCARAWREHIHQGRLEVVADNLPHEQPLVLLRTVPRSKSGDESPHSEVRRFGVR